MSISYTKLINYIERRGITVNTLARKGIITDDAAKKIRAGKSVNLYHIDAICQFLKVPIEQIIEIKIDDPSRDSDNQ